jgi:hypothetical protein
MPDNLLAKKQGDGQHLGKSGRPTDPPVRKMLAELASWTADKPKEKPGR